MTITSKQRAYLKGLAMTMDPIFQIGKSSVTLFNLRTLYHIHAFFYFYSIRKILVDQFFFREILLLKNNRFNL